MTVINAEHFLALQLLLGDPSAPSPSMHEWPGDLPAGEYACEPAHCSIPAWRELSLFQRSGRPYLSTNGSTGTVRRTQHTQLHGTPCWQWLVNWDDGSGTLKEEMLWLRMLDAQHFQLYNSQGRCNAYGLIAAEALPVRSLWPKPLYTGVYQAIEAPNAPDYLQQLELMEYGDEPLLQCAIGICTLEDTSVDRHGGYHATLAWSLRDDASLQPITHIHLRIQDGEHFEWLHADGYCIRYVWVKDI